MTPSDNSEGMLKRRLRALKTWLRKNPWTAGTAALIAALLIVVAWPYVAITVYPGSGGVFYSRFFGGVDRDRVFGEGIHFIWPWNKLYVFDARIQQEKYDMVILMDSGMSVEVSLVCNHRLEYTRLPELLQRVGEDYKKRLLVPALNTAVRSVLGNYDFEDSHWMLSRLQDEVFTSAVELLQAYPVIVESVAVTNITLPQKLSEAIISKQEANQNYLAERFRVLQAEQKFRRNYIEAEAVRVTQETISKGLTEPYLRWAGIEATKSLATSPNAKTLVIGGKDGLPIILNPDGPLAATPTLPQPSQKAPVSSASDTTPGPHPEDAPELTAEKLQRQSGSVLERSESALESVKSRLESISRGIAESLSSNEARR